MLFKNVKLTIYIDITANEERRSAGTSLPRVMAQSVTLREQPIHN